MARYLIIAAGSGIGQSLVQHLRQGGHEVMTTARSDRTITPDHVLDAADFDAVDAVFAKLGKLDGVVNLAGSLLLKSAGLTSRSQYDATITASLTTAFATVRAAARHMTEGGSVVLLSSAAALEGLANHEAIAAAKAGVIGLTRSAAASYAGQNLRVNAIAPGLVETPLTAGLVGSDAGRRVSESMHALGRLGKPEDVARAIAFLLDPQNDWITGQVLGVDGGLSRVRPKLKV
ncbi:SDR family oxidoreductase [Asticcacaulis excentricus]|uniref:Short-chain dehydrogenase/reductase SDR n=1 Tax=Asticcacaulis excentricus (strain ATCC 15261 / DSM 4724 / KCTC 12464 / NCIMB 9791 / VKM B-1370 / CB 48) TaxID=573065 RepID=E8RPC5_ASTEC|nr:SDR family oxidoreductase [Asticcacaulis excentricus]ADU11971.1 short-chain dehydrogenase/reductase SDR [Asticcacaulis excentricus CB 48]